MTEPIYFTFRFDNNIDADQMIGKSCKDNRTDRTMGIIESVQSIGDEIWAQVRVTDPTLYRQMLVNQLNKDVGMSMGYEQG